MHPQKASLNPSKYSELLLLTYNSNDCYSAGAFSRNAHGFAPLAKSGQQIVNIGWRLEDIDTVKLARWVRCLFQLALTTKNEIAEFLLDQVSTLAQNEKMVRRLNVPPVK